MTVKQSDFTGIIDGVNKVFSIPVGTTQVLKVIFDGSHYDSSKYVVDINLLTITLDDAPIDNISGWTQEGTGTLLNDFEEIIFGEIPGGTIDGTNKTFVLASTPKRILESIHDGVSYSGYNPTPTTSQIEVTDAPSDNLSFTYVIDTLQESDASEFSSNSSQSDLITKTYSVLKESSTGSDNYELEEVKDKLNEYQSSILTGIVVNLLSKSVYTGRKLSFLRKTTNIKHVGDMSLMKDFNQGDSIIYLDSIEKIPASGKVELNGIIITYGMTYSGTDGVGITGLEVDGLTYGNRGDKVIKVYSLPYNYGFELIAKTYINGEEVTIPGMDSRGNVRSSITRIKTNEEKGTFTISSLAEDRIVSLSYNRRSIDMTSLLNSMIPGKYAKAVLPYLVAGDLMQDNNDDRANKTLEKGYAKLDEFYRNHGRRDSSFEQSMNQSNYNENLSHFNIY